jgi:hypothetical protein
MFGLGRKLLVVGVLGTEGEVVEEEEVELECAWCLAEQGIVPTSGSHGICAFHSQQMFVQMEERRVRRRGWRS